MYSVVPFVYFLRVPLLIATALAFFAPFALADRPFGIDNTTARSLLRGLFDLEAAGVGFATGGALLTCGLCWMSSAIVLEYGHLRFKVPDPHGPRNRWTVKIPILVIQNWSPILNLLVSAKGRREWRAMTHAEWVQALRVAVSVYRPAAATVWIGVLYGLVALSLISGIVIGSRATPWETAIACCLGAIAFFIFVLVLVLIREDRIFSSINSLNDSMSGLRFLPSIEFTETLAGLDFVRRFFARFDTGLVPKLMVWTSEGYLDRRQRQQHTLLPGHGSAIAATAALLLLFLVLGGWRLMFLLGIWKRPSDAPEVLPTILYVFLLASIACLAFSSVAFFLDRFRIPLLLPWFVVTGMFAEWPHSDHFFHARWTEPKPELSPSAVIGARQGDSLIVVCAAGGGIHAAAWTAKVLTELDRAHGISRHLAAVSGVSGGSVGAMHLLAAYQGGSIPPGSHERIFAHASASSLEQVTWGLAYPDLFKLVLPFSIPAEYGRGWALERAWDRDRKLAGMYLSDWRKDVAAGLRPAALFNATVVETGERLLFADFDMDSKGAGTRTLKELYSVDGKAPDVLVTTAVRLSATFPFVTPAARPNGDVPRGQRYHVVDGGYYDNYGVASMVDFLDQALGEDVPSRIKKVLVIQIRCSARRRERTLANGDRGWVFQSTVPLTTLASVRDSAQASRGDLELSLLAKSRRSLDLRTVSFEYPDESIPLSWHLTRDQIRVLHDKWNNHFPSESCEQKAVHNFVDGGAPISKSFDVCAAAGR